MMSRVNHLTDLKRGDHVCVGLNPLRKIVRPFDKLLQYLTHLELFPAYHHFVMYDDVHHVSNSVPMTASGTAAMMCEYSNTPCGAILQIWEYGFMSLLRSPAPFMRIPLCDYVEGCSPGPAVGVFKVAEDLTAEERDEIVGKMDALLASHETYSFIYRNCEHAAFSFNPRRAVWVSPQVPYLMWNMLRFSMGALSACCLWTLRGEDLARGDVHRYHLASIAYHLLSTVPVCLQSVIQLMRTVMSMTAKRVRNEVTSTVFWHIVYKESSRAVVAGGLACLCLGLLPKMVEDTGYVKAAGLLCVFAFTLSNGLFNALCFSVVRPISFNPSHLQYLTNLLCCLGSSSIARNLTLSHPLSSPHLSAMHPSLTARPLVAGEVKGEIWGG
ncbi:hypothetical protein TrRE_jg11036 [Triparma retinervis]|uniref:LRAT domain-containing protein n=1 Tax=Triparma retinervis TaxID=2557542 RepID=A0A9W6ZPA6_9STRA|nr:hypothetical protein TrRE_jg11036 [Triparma retinervis]